MTEPRRYRFQAAEDSVEAFRRLRGAWRDVHADEHAVVVRLQDGGAVRITVDRHDIEPGFAAVSIVADAYEAGAAVPLPAGEPLLLSDLGLGGNDAVLFTGAAWIETAKVDGAPPDRDLEAVMQQAGHPGEVPPEAEAVCLTHDAIVVASPVGTGALVRIASIAGRLEVITDRAVIGAFLTDRGYDG